MEERAEIGTGEAPTAGEEGAAAARFWRAFTHYDHGRCWFGELEEEDAGSGAEGASSAAMEWDLRGPARFEAEWDRAMRTGGSRLAAKAPRPYGDAGVCGRAAYALQLLAALYALADQIEAEARGRGWELTVGVLAYREPEEGSDGEEDEAPDEDLVTELDPEELARCDTLVLWVEIELPRMADGAWRLGDTLGRMMAGAGRWLERLDAGDREALRSVPRLQG